MAWNQDFGEGANPGSGYEQQSWRDSYNGGQAAGDWTGNTNARLDSERDRFQGATWSGSSSQPSALELARSFVGSGQSGGTNGRGPTGTGAGHEAVVPRKTSGGNLTFSGTGAGAYRPGFSPGVIDWRTPLQFTNAPEIDGIENKPLKRVGIGGAQEAPGAISDIGWSRTSNGGYIVVPSSDVKERIEDDFFTQSQWSWRNIWGPSIGVMPQPRPDFLDPRGSYFDFWSGEWREGSQHGKTVTGATEGGGGW